MPVLSTVGELADVMLKALLDVIEGLLTLAIVPMRKLGAQARAFKKWSRRILEAEKRRERETVPRFRPRDDEYVNDYRASLEMRPIAGSTARAVFVRASEVVESLSD